jgi:hypothetical protein
MLRAIEAPPRSERQAQLIADASEMAMDEQPSSNLIGYVVLTMYSDGAMRTAGWRPNTEDHKLGNQLFQAWARAGLEHHISYAEGVDACYSVLNGDA